MPLRRLPFPLQPSRREPVIIPRPAPPKLGVIQTTSSLIADMRMSTIWYAIMERSYGEALQKLEKTVRDDFKLDPAQVIELVPCLVDLSEAHTKAEEERIRRAHRAMSTIFARFIDQLVRFRPESRSFAYDRLKQSIMDARPLWRPYECETFRGPIAKEKEPKKKKKRAYWDYG